jgi:hypothetical protein
LRKFVPPFNPASELLVIAVVGSGLSFLFIVEAISGRYDWLLISGGFALILGLYLARGLPERLEYLLERLLNRGVLLMTPESLNCFQQDLERRIRKYWAPYCGLLIMFAIFGSFLYSFSILELSDKLFLLFIEMVGGYIVGCYLGRMACYGMLGPFIGQTDSKLRVRPGHLDAAAGMKPVGEFYLYQSALVGIPAIFLAIWSVLILFPYFHGMYAHWQKSYIGLLALAILFEVVSFISPLVWFHREMSKQKRILSREADQLSREIADLSDSLARGLGADEAKSVTEKKMKKQRAI